MADITLTWTPDPAAVAQELYYSVQGTITGNPPGNGWTAYTGNPLSGTANTVDLLNLTDNLIYEFAIWSDCGNGSFSTFLTGNFDTTPTPCNPPASVTAIVNGSNLDVTWTAIPGEIYTITEATTSYSQTNAWPPVSIPVIPGQIYNLTVAHDCANGLTGTVNIIDTVPNASCLPVTSVTVTGITATSATINWVSAGPATYTIYHGTTVVGTTTSNSITLTGLTPGTIYHYTIVKTCSLNNNSTPVPADFTTACDQGTFAMSESNTPVPCAPPIFTVTPMGAAYPTKLLVNVTNLLPGESYDISIDGGATYIITGLSTTPAIVSGLTANTTYTVVVKRYCQVSGTSTTSHTATTSTAIVPTINFEVGLTTKDETPSIQIADPGTNIAVGQVSSITGYSLYANFTSWRAYGSNPSFPTSCTPDYMVHGGPFMHTESAAYCGSQSTLGTISKRIDLKNVFIPDGVNITVSPLYSGQTVNVLSTIADTGNPSTVRVFVNGWNGPGNIVDIKINAASIIPDSPSIVSNWAYPRVSSFPIIPSTSMVAHTPSVGNPYVDVEIHTTAPINNLYTSWDPVIFDSFGRRNHITSKTLVGGVYINKFHGVAVSKGLGMIWIAIHDLTYYNTI